MCRRERNRGDDAADEARVSVRCVGAVLGEPQGETGRWKGAIGGGSKEEVLSGFDVVLFVKRI